MKLASMTRLAPAALALTFAFVASAPAQDVTPTERDKAQHYLADTRNNLADAVKGLSEAQWKFKSAPDRWSIAEVVEHLALLEDGFSKAICPQLMRAPAGTRSFESNAQ